MDNKKKLATRILFAAGMTLAYHMTALAQDAPAQPASAQAPAAPAVQSLSQMHFAAGGLNLTPTDAQGHAVHIYPTPKAARALLAVPTPTGALNYNGGPIMPSIGIYSIFWLGKLQSGGTATLTSHYETVADDFAADYAGHSISSNNTQYYQSSPSAYVTGLSTIGSAGSYGGSYVDTDSFPASGCSDSATPGNCITDAQLQAELKKVMAKKKWTGGFNKIYLVYTGQGEGSCFDSSSSSCAYTAYCAYHGSISGKTPVIYGNMPYGDPNYCFDPGAGQTSPNGDIPADAVVNVASHEVTEAITDPLLNAWWDTSNGEEIGDLCAWTFGTAGWDSGNANQMWNGRFYDLQLEYDNFTGSCVQVGP
jgi:hypothetical protein